MRNPCPLLVVLFGAIELTGAEAGPSTLVQTDAVTSQLLEWLNENGAYINEKLVVRHVVSDDPSSPRGVFATQSMEEGETVCRIPWNLIVKPRDWQWKDKGEVLDCGTIEEIKEMMSNRMTPYGEYLLAQPKGYTPGFWSEAAMGLLNDMLDTDKDVHETEYDGLPPHDIEDVLGDIAEECDGDIDDELYRHAAQMVKARGDYAFLVPFYDMMNHHNGKFNVKHRYNPYDFESSDLVERFGYDIITTKALNAGEELINSYNRCSSACTQYYDWFGTPEMLLHYGFVESLPQRWLFDFARIKFDLDWKDSDEATNEVVVKFLVPPSEKGIKLLQQELTRLESFALVRETMNYEDEGISAGEWESLWLYYDALHDALSYAVKSNASVTDDVWTWSDDWWVKDGTLVSANTYEHTVYPTKRSCDSNASQSQLCSNSSLQDHAVLSSQAPEEEMRRFTDDASH
ncbi:hypothetical protein ACHAWF_016148 [Thalassiosira exigua]